MYRFCPLLIALLLSSCSPEAEPLSATDTPSDQAPSWANEVVWYQIFVERFRNGDPNNDPKPADIVGTYPGFVPDGWATTPWTSDWYAPDPWFSEVHGKRALRGELVESFGQKAQLRRYGGDLQGVLDRLDYLDSLGVSAIYFNPLNDAPSLHKYDARTWRHIDRNFGPTPEADRAQIADEDPTNPETWTWTAADWQFLDLIESLHARGIRVILDYSWNHTGDQFWAFKDVRERGEESPYSEWYWINSFDDPATPENEFDYQGWFGVPSLPEIKETIFHDPTIAIKAYEGDIESQQVKDHIFAISRRWLDPNGDGDTSDGVDGFRLDVAAELGLGFWREYRSVVRAVNPEAYLVGEVWWEKWPDRLLDPSPFLQGDVFDAVMNYRWYRSTRRFFAEAPDRMPVTEFVDSLRAYERGIARTHRYAMMNVAASHDTPRVSTSLFNRRKYKLNTSLGADPSYQIQKPDAETYETLSLLLAHQFTYVGAPHIWAGDEMGMWGADDPSTRKPLIWPDLTFEDERAHGAGGTRPVDPVAFDTSLFNHYRQLISIRHAHPVLSHGDLEYLITDDDTRVLAFRRFDDRNEVIAVFNADRVSHEVVLPVDGNYDDVLSGRSVANGAGARVTMPARSASILVRRAE